MQPKKHLQWKKNVHFALHETSIQSNTIHIQYYQQCIYQQSLVLCTLYSIQLILQKKGKNYDLNIASTFKNNVKTNNETVKSFSAHSSFPTEKRLNIQNGTQFRYQDPSWSNCGTRMKKQILEHWGDKRQETSVIPSSIQWTEFCGTALNQTLSINLSPEDVDVNYRAFNI